MKFILIGVKRKLWILWASRRRGRFSLADGINPTSARTKTNKIKHFRRAIHWRGQYIQMWKCRHFRGGGKKQQITVPFCYVRPKSTLSRLPPPPGNVITFPSRHGTALPPPTRPIPVPCHFFCLWTQCRQNGAAHQRESLFKNPESKFEKKNRLSRHLRTSNSEVCECKNWKSEFN